MYYNIDWEILFKNEGGKDYQLGFMSNIEIVRSVSNLVDTATITLPELVMNKALSFENKIQRGSEIKIKLGYNAELINEFSGYIKNISVVNGELKIECEDALFLFRKGLQDKHFKQANLKKIAEYIAKEIDSSYKVECDYDMSFDKFTIHKASGYSVLKKLKEISKADIFFDTENKILHIHAPFSYNTGKVKYSAQANIEDLNLEYEDPSNSKLEVNIESIDNKGKVQKTKAGTTGGKNINIKASTLSKSSIDKLANNILNENKKGKYKGSFDTWLLPFVAPGYSALIYDEDYPDKKDWYYVQAVTTSVGSGGCKRTVTPSIKL